MLRSIGLIGLIGFLFYPKWIEGELFTCFIKIAWCSFLWILVSLLLTSPFITSHNLVQAFTQGEVAHMLCVNNRTRVNVQLFYFSLPPPHLLGLVFIQVNGSLAKNQPERLRWGKWSVTPTCWTITFKTLPCTWFLSHLHNSRWNRLFSLPNWRVWYPRGVTSDYVFSYLVIYINGELIIPYSLTVKLGLWFGLLFICLIIIFFFFWVLWWWVYLFVWQKDVTSVGYKNTAKRLFASTLCERA